VKKKIAKCAKLLDKYESPVEIEMTTEMKEYQTEDSKYHLSIIFLSPPVEIVHTSCIIDPNS